MDNLVANYINSVYTVNRYMCVCMFTSTLS